MNYIDLNNLLSRMESLVDVSENVRHALENGGVNFLVLLDRSKAFDTVDYNMLIRNLKFFFRFSNTSDRLLHSYLSQTKTRILIA